MATGRGTAGMNADGCVRGVRAGIFEALGERSSVAFRLSAGLVEFALQTFVVLERVLRYLAEPATMTRSSSKS
jgi:hypothetical protein